MSGPERSRGIENYFECHITIEPVFEEDLEKVSDIAKWYQFRPAKLLMQRRKSDTPERSKYDTFMTGRSYDRVDLEQRMLDLIGEIQEAGFMVWRYKIEETMLDSRYYDLFHVLGDDLPDKEKNPRPPVAKQELEEAL